MSVVLSVEDTGPCRKQLKVEVPGSVVEAETDRVVSEFRRRARLPGFRKGKVPSQLILQKYRKDIEQEVVDRLLPRYWRQAEAETELDPLLPPSVEEVDLQPGSGLTFVASVEIRPRIELGELEGFDLPEMEVEPSDEEVDRALEEMRRAVADWIDTERPAGQGDLVVADLMEIDGSEPIDEPSAEAQQVSFEVGDVQVWEELSLAVTGKSSGQVSEFERRQGSGEDEQGKRYRVCVTAVKERELPELDADLAAQLGDYRDVDSLRQDVGERLKKAKRLERDRKREQAVLDQLRQRHPLELPAGVVRREIEGLLRDYGRSLAGTGVDLDDPQLDWQAMAEQVRPEAERRVHSRLLLDAIADALDVRVAEDEFERTLATIARAQKTSTVALRQELDRSGNLTALREQLRREGALRRLLGEESSEGEQETPTDDLDGTSRD